MPCKWIHTKTYINTNTHNGGGGLIGLDAMWGWVFCVCHSCEELGIQNIVLFTARFTLLDLTLPNGFGKFLFHLLSAVFSFAR